MTNPYAPPVSPPPSSPKTRSNACPVCGHKVFRWTIINSLNRYRCKGCGATLEVQVPRALELLYVVSLISLCAASLILSGTRAGSASFYSYLAIIGGAFAIFALPFRALSGTIVGKS